jgi:acyl-CoA thioesterase I
MRRALAIITAVIAAAAVVLALVAGPADASAHGRLHPVRAHSLLVIGASYSAGWGATSPRLDYAHRLAADLGWPATVSAEPGAGYISAGDNGHDSFREQIQSLPATLRPGVVIIQGGRDDIGRPATEEARAVARTIAAVRAKFGDPQVVLVGDIPASVPVAHDAVQMNDLLARVASIEHAVFIDPIRAHWISAKDAATFRSAVPGHPNNAGHAYIAQRLLIDLRAITA